VEKIEAMLVRQARKNSLVPRYVTGCRTIPLRHWHYYGMVFSKAEEVEVFLQREKNQFYVPSGVDYGSDEGHDITGNARMASLDD